jgi:hypothetical protein
VIPDQASFYLLEAGSDPIVEISPVSVSNGPAWSEDNTQMYYTDTATGQVDVFDFDLERAKIGEYCGCRQTASIFSLKLFCVLKGDSSSGSDVNHYVIIKRLLESDLGRSGTLHYLKLSERQHHRVRPI